MKLFNRRFFTGVNMEWKHFYISTSVTWYTGSRKIRRLFLTTNKQNSYKTLRLRHFTPFSGNTCKLQLYFVIILKISLLFCKKLQWNCGCCVFTRLSLRLHPVSFSADAAGPCSLLGSDWHLWPCSYLGGCGWSRGQGPAAPAHGHGSCPALFTRPHPPLHSEQGSACLQNVKHIVREEAQSCILLMFLFIFYHLCSEMVACCLSQPVSHFSSSSRRLLAMLDGA